MINFIKQLLGIETKYLITMSCSKHGGKYYPKGPKSNSHKGINISNTRGTVIVSIRNYVTLQDDLERAIKDKHPNSSNFLIESIVRL